MGKDERIGFKTPSLKIHDEYKEILEQITSRKADWNKVYLLARRICTRLSNDLDEIDNNLEQIIDDNKVTTEEDIKKKKQELTKIGIIEKKADRVLLLLTQHLLMIPIAKIGKELSEYAVRISNIEKELKDMRRAI